MGMTKIASRNSSKTFAAGDLTLTVASGAPVTVYGIWLSNVDDSDEHLFTIADAEGTTIQAVEVLADTTIELSVCWKADAGIQVTGVAGDGVTVFHDSPGN
jgi:hypothetical protein